MSNVYATVEKFRERMTDKELIKALSDDPANEKSVNSTRLQQYVDLANQLVDDALRVRYILPLSNGSSDTVLEDIALHIVKYNVIGRKRAEDIPAVVKSNYEDAMSRLNAYRTGDLRLDADESPTKPSIINVRAREGGMSKILRNY